MNKKKIGAGQFDKSKLRISSWQVAKSMSVHQNVNWKN